MMARDIAAVPTARPTHKNATATPEGPGSTGGESCLCAGTTNARPGATARPASTRPAPSRETS